MKAQECAVVGDQLLQDPISRLFIWAARTLFGQSPEQAAALYQIYIRDNKQEILTICIMVLLLVAFYLAMGRFTHWLEDIRAATRRLVEEREDRHFGVTIALYRLGATQLLDRQFAWELVFWDEQLHSISLTLEEGEDLAAFYQELEEGLADRFGLEDFSQVDLQSPLTLPSGAAYDQVNTSMAASDSGETTLTLTGLFQGDALVQLGLSLAANDNG